MIISVAELTRICQDLLMRAGVPEKSALRAAETLVSADARGISSHGVIRLARYIDCMKSGGIIPDAEIKIIDEGPAFIRASAAGGLGIPASCEVVERLIAKSASMPLAAASINHSDHYGAAGYYAMKCADAGLIGFSMSNTCPLIAVTGAAAAGIGNNPFAYAAPAGRYRAVLFDICMSVVASGKLIIAAADNKPIPEGWILDKDGRPTTDPKEIYNGAIMLPFGGHKGYGLAMMVEMLSGVLAGAGTLSGVNSWNTVPGRDADTGHFFLTINPAFFGGLDNFNARMEAVIEELTSAPKADGVNKIYYPGELEFISEAKAFADGIDLPDASAAELERAGKMLK
ncbi:MAG: Ldh family oxidoreductase [Lentisphaeria bacterium]|nr:Ldh family oxidoreductase [Lentisphaeria bacterium]